MKMSSISLPMFCATAVAWQIQSPLGTQEDKVKVPGENPLTYCAKPIDYLLNVDYLDLTPNPPVPGKNLSINAGGTLSKEIAAGSKVHIKVVWNYVTLLNQDYDLCESAHEVDLECPLKKGVLNITKEVEIPSQVPPGKYVVSADVYTENHAEEITCLEGSINF